MKELAKQILEQFSACKVEILSSKDSDYLIICYAPKDKFKDLIMNLKNHPDFTFTILTDLSAVDYPDHEKRFEVIYNLLSIKNNWRIIIKVRLDDAEEIESIYDLFNASIWYEREVWDMFGIRFKNNPDLRRILTDYGFSGHPLRKDFPLTGFKEVRYDLEQKKVIYEPVDLMQEFRAFDFLSPWEGPNYALPGDEKAKK